MAGAGTGLSQNVWISCEYDIKYVRNAAAAVMLHV